MDGTGDRLKIATLPMAADGRASHAEEVGEFVDIQNLQSGELCFVCFHAAKLTSNARKAVAQNKKDAAVSSTTQQEASDSRKGPWQDQQTCS